MPLGRILAGVEPAGVAGVAAAPPVSAKALTASLARSAIDASRASRSVGVLKFADIRHPRLRGELTGSRRTETALRPRWADSPQRIDSIRIGSPVCLDLSLGSSALRGSIQSAQDRGRRASTSLNRRSPVENPALASSPISSAAPATNSVAPGG